jgi:hypothetical protein
MEHKLATALEAKGGLCGEKRARTCLIFFFSAGVSLSFFTGPAACFFPIV